MINSVNAVPQVVAPDANIIFTTDRVRTKACGCGGWLIHEEGSGIFNLARPGIYKIDFNANVTADAAGATTLAIRRNGEVVPGTEMDYTVVTAGVYQNVSVSTLVVVQPYVGGTIAVANISADDVTVDDANIIITRIA